MQAHKVETKIMSLPGYQDICLQQEDGTCHAPFGLPTAVYAKAENLVQGVDVGAGNVEAIAGSRTGNNTYQLADKYAHACQTAIDMPSAAHSNHRMLSLLSCGAA
jgi:hypothetical protein